MNPLRTLLRIGVAFAATALVLSGCGGDDESADTTATTAGAGDSELTISDVWARPAEDLTASDRSAVYMVIQGGDVDDALLAASVPTDVAAVTEVHETVAEGDMGSDDTDSGDMGSDDADSGEMGSGDMDSGDMDSGDMDSGGMDGGMMSMREVSRIDVPAGSTVLLEPGGFHVMLLELAQPLVPGETIEVTLTFEVAGERVVTAEVRQP